MPRSDKGARNLFSECFQGFSPAGSFEQSEEVGLVEMMIAGKRFPKALALHDRERNAVGQRPLLVAWG